MAELYGLSEQDVEGLGKNVQIGDVVTVILTCIVRDQRLCTQDNKTVLTNLEVQDGQVKSVGRSMAAAFRKSKSDHATEKPGSRGVEPSVSVTTQE